MFVSWNLMHQAHSSAQIRPARQNFDQLSQLTSSLKLDNICTLCFKTLYKVSWVKLIFQVEIREDVSMFRCSASIYDDESTCSIFIMVSHLPNAWITAMQNFDCAKHLRIFPIIRLLYILFIPSTFYNLLYTSFWEMQKDIEKPASNLSYIMYSNILRWNDNLRQLSWIQSHNVTSDTQMSSFYHYLHFGILHYLGLWLANWTHLFSKIY